MAAMIQSFWAVLGLLVSANACTIIAVGRAASASGAPMIGHSDDAGSSTNDIRLIRVPRQRWPEGSKRPVYFWQIGYPRLVSSERSPEYAAVGDQKDTHPLGFVPQVPETWAYWDTNYGVQNEWGLSIGESTSSARTVGWPASKPQ
ncbi:pipD, partial [Symbiodinium necroappetens]